MTALISEASGSRWFLPACLAILVLGGGALWAINYFCDRLKPSLPNWEQVYRDIASRFPAVKQLGTGELANLLIASKPDSDLLIVDCRDKKVGVGLAGNE